MNTQTYTCAGCIWEDACRADDPGCTRCGDFCSSVSDITYSLLSYLSDLADRIAEYQSIVEEQQS